MYEAEIKKYSEKYGLNPALVEAIIIKESGYDTWAVRYEKNWKWLLTPEKFARKNKISLDTEVVLQSCSLGLMQVMGTVARELGFSLQLTKLCVPHNGVNYGCKKLADCLRRHGSLDRALAAYNAGNPEYEAGKRYAKSVLEIMQRVNNGKC